MGFIGRGGVLGTIQAEWTWCHLLKWEIVDTVPPWPILLNVDDVVNADSSCSLPGGQKCVSGRRRDEIRVTLKYGPGLETEAK